MALSQQTATTLDQDHATRTGRPGLGFYLAVLAGMMGSSWLSRLHVGGYDNVLLPAVAVLSIGFGLGAAALQSALADSPAGGARGALGRVGGAPLAGLYLVAIWQLLVLAYPPYLQVPRNRDRRSGDAMIRTLARFDGDIFMLEHGFLPAMAGHDAIHAHGSAIWDVLQTDDGVSLKLRAELSQAIRGHKFDVLVLDAPHPSEQGFWEEIARKVGLDKRELSRESLLDLCKDEIEADYLCVGHVFQRDDVFWPVTGVALRPDRIYVPKDSPLARQAQTALRPKARR